MASKDDRKRISNAVRYVEGMQNSTARGPRRRRPGSAFPFLVKITASSGSAPPYSYSWSEVQADGVTEGDTSATGGYLFNAGEQPDILDPDGTSADITYPPIGNGSVVPVFGVWPAFTVSTAPWTDAEDYAGLYYTLINLQPAREDC